MKLKLLIFNLLLPVALFATQDSLPGKKLQWRFNIAPEMVKNNKQEFTNPATTEAKIAEKIGFGITAGARGRFFILKGLAVNFGLQIASRKSVEKREGLIFESDIILGNGNVSSVETALRIVSLDLPTMLEWHFKKPFFVAAGMNSEIPIKSDSKIRVFSKTEPLGDGQWMPFQSGISDPAFSMLFAAGFKISKNGKRVFEICPVFRHSFSRIHAGVEYFGNLQNSFGLRGSLFFK